MERHYRSMERLTATSSCRGLALALGLRRGLLSRDKLDRTRQHVPGGELPAPGPSRRCRGSSAPVRIPTMGRSRCSRAEECARRAPDPEPATAAWVDAPVVPDGIRRQHRRPHDDLDQRSLALEPAPRGQSPAGRGRLDPPAVAGPLRRTAIRTHASSAFRPAWARTIPRATRPSPRASIDGGRSRSRCAGPPCPLSRERHQPAGSRSGHDVPARRNFIGDSQRAGER